MAERRGRPLGTSGRAAVLSASQVRQVFRVAHARSRHSARAEATLAISLGLGLRAKELTSLKWDDVYDAKGHVRMVLHLRAAYTKGGKTRDVFLSSPTLRRAFGQVWRGTVAPESLARAPLS
jgi:integrase